MRSIRHILSFCYLFDYAPTSRIFSPGPSLRRPNIGDEMSFVYDPNLQAKVLAEPTDDPMVMEKALERFLQGRADRFVSLDHVYGVPFSVHLFFPTSIDVGGAELAESQQSPRGLSEELLRQMYTETVFPDRPPEGGFRKGFKISEAIFDGNPAAMVCAAWVPN